jgi:hypothetical protein
MKKMIMGLGCLLIAYLADSLLPSADGPNEIEARLILSAILLGMLLAGLVLMVKGLRQILRKRHKPDF